MFTMCSDAYTYTCNTNTSPCSNIHLTQIHCHTAIHPLRCDALLAGLVFRGHALLLALLVCLAQQLLALIDRLVTQPLLRTATKSASTASACDQALAQADGFAPA